MAGKLGNTQTVDGIEEIDREEIVAEIDREARRRLGMTFEEFYAEYREGNLPDTLAVNELVILLRFAGLGRGTAA